MGKSGSRLIWSMSQFNLNLELMNWLCLFLKLNIWDFEIFSLYPDTEPKAFKNDNNFMSELSGCDK